MDQSYYLFFYSGSNDFNIGEEACEGENLDDLQVYSGTAVDLFDASGWMCRFSDESADDVYRTFEDYDLDVNCEAYEHEWTITRDLGDIVVASGGMGSEPYDDYFFLFMVVRSARRRRRNNV